MPVPVLIPSLQRIFAPPYQDYMGLALADMQPSIPVMRLFADGQLDEWLARCAAHYQRPDAGGIASFWAQRYLRALLPASLVANLVLQRELPLQLEQAAVVIDAEQGLPQMICMLDEGRPGPGADVFACTQTLIKRHLEPFAVALAGRVRLSPRVVLSSAAFLAYQVFQMLAAQGLIDAAQEQRYRALFEQPRWPDGAPNPFFKPLITTTPDGRSGLFKRICCLSFTLQELGRCASCPAR